MAQITIYPKDGQKAISFSVKKVTGGYKEGDIRSAIDFENEDGSTGRVFINKEAVVAVVISQAGSST